MIDVYTTLIGVFIAKKASKMKQDIYQPQFPFHVFGFCTCANIKRVPGCKETDPDV